MILGSDNIQTQFKIKSNDGLVTSLVGSPCQGPINLSIKGGGAPGPAGGQFSGHEQYFDTEYTQQSPFLLQANMPVQIPNNLGIKLLDQTPVDLVGINMVDFATGKIKGRNGDGIAIDYAMTGIPLSNNVTVTMWLDIGGQFTYIYPYPNTLSAGANIPQPIRLLAPAAYNRQTWEDNGGTVMIEADGPVEIYDIQLLLHRISKAK